LHTGAAAGHESSPVQPDTHWCCARSQVGVGALQSLELSQPTQVRVAEAQTPCGQSIVDRQPTHVSLPGSQTGVVPVQRPVWPGSHSVHVPARAPLVAQTGRSAGH
jgi:hypothetical protein